MKILTIIGARPQFIKAAVLSRIIKSDNMLNEVLVHTGQHYDENMSDIFFEEMDIPKPKYNLHIKSNHHGEMTGLMIQEIEKVVLLEKPDCILVYGDTNSTLAGAIVASKLHNIKLIHVEAGLRSFNNNMPEEINRIITDRVSDILFCPTDTAINNLENEGFSVLKDKKIVKTGDIMLDAALFYSKKIENVQINFPEKFALCTIHRAENTDDDAKLIEIFEALNKIGQDICRVLLPLHPRTKSKITALLPNFESRFQGIRLVDPLSYFEMIKALKIADFVITDSGGLQKEAFFFKKMCLTLRDQTEWVELVEGGFNLLTSIKKEEIFRKAEIISKSKKDFNINLYGKGNAGELIIEELKKL